MVINEKKECKFMKKIMIIIGMGLVLSMALCGCSVKEVTSNVKTDNTDTTVVLTEIKTTQYFSDEKVAEDDMQKILSAGVNAPSAMNTQPWHFTAVTSEDVTKKLADAMDTMRPPAFKDGNMPSPPEQRSGEKPKDIPEKSDNPPQKPPMPDGEKPDFSNKPNKAGIGDAPLTIVISCEEGSELSAGLAIQNMSAEAQLLGYGTKILTSPTIALNGENQAEYKELLNIPENQKVAAVLLVGKAASGEENDAMSSATTRNSFDEMVTVLNQ